MGIYPLTIRGEIYTFILLLIKHLTSFYAHISQIPISKNAHIVQIYAHIV